MYVHVCTVYNDVCTSDDVCTRDVPVMYDVWCMMYDVCTSDVPVMYVPFSYKIRHGTLASNV